METNFNQSLLLISGVRLLVPDMRGKPHGLHPHHEDAALLSGFADLVDEIGQGFRNPLRILPEFIPFFPWNRNVLPYSLVEYDSLFTGFFR